jgi:hypothetical protein
MNFLFKKKYDDYEKLLPHEVKYILESDDFQRPIIQYYKK